MTDENKDGLNEENQATIEQADGPEEDLQEAEQTVDNPPEGEDEPVQELGAPIDEEEDPSEDLQGAGQAGDSLAEGEQKVESTDEQIDWTDDGPADEPEEDLQTVEQTMDDLPEGEEEPDQESVESMDEEDEASDEGEADVQTEEPAEPEQAPTVESVVEAILFATDEPLTESRLANIVETTTKQVRTCIKDLNAKYEANHSAFRIEQIAGGCQMLTLSTYNHWLKKMLRARSDSKLSPAAMETLAIIAYKQPIIRADIEAIRGVAVGEVVRSIMYKGLVKIVGRAEVLGRPMLYGTTRKFLEVFGLNSLKDLPKAEELKNPDRG